MIGDGLTRKGVPRGGFGLLFVAARGVARSWGELGSKGGVIRWWRRGLLTIALVVRKGEWLGLDAVMEEGEGWLCWIFGCEVVGYEQWHGLALLVWFVATDGGLA